MASSFLLSLTAIAALIPAAIAPTASAGSSAKDEGGLFWWLLGVAIAGPALWLAVEFGTSWRTGLAPALWLIILASLLLFAGFAAFLPVARRLTTPLFGYLILLGALAVVYQQAPERPLAGNPPPAWLQAHILVSIAAFGLLTLAAVAGFAVVLQERALKRKRPSSLARQLPSVADGEALQVRLLVASEFVLAAALVTGMTIDWIEYRAVLRFDHKTVLSLLTFAGIAVVLFLHHRSGLRGRRAARYILVAYLMLTLAYPGVKFVTDVLIG